MFDLINFFVMKHPEAQHIEERQGSWIKHKRTTRELNFGVEILLKILKLEFVQKKSESTAWALTQVYAHT